MKKKIMILYSQNMHNFHYPAFLLFDVSPTDILPQDSCYSAIYVQFIVIQVTIAYFGFMTWYSVYISSYLGYVQQLFDFGSCYVQLPQQQNSYDCGLFLLHYVELFLEEVPVNFSIYSITSSSKFVSTLLCFTLADMLILVFITHEK